MQQTGALVRAWTVSPHIDSGGKSTDSETENPPTGQCIVLIIKLLLLEVGPNFMAA